MSNFSIQKVNTLPGVLDSHTLYFVKSSYSGYLDTFMSTASGSSSKRLMSYDDVTTVINSRITSTPIGNKIPTTNANGVLDSSLFNPVPSVSGAALHRSPDSIVGMCVYDTNNDTDSGEWTMRCSHTSWYNEPLSGKWLGRHDSETSARNYNGITGIELVSNSIFKYGTMGYKYSLTNQGTVSIANNVATLSLVTTADRAYLRLYSPITTVNGTLYRVIITMSITSGQPYIHVGTTLGGTELISTLLVAGTNTVYFTATSSATYVEVSAGVLGNTVCSVSMLSVKTFTRVSTTDDYFQLTTNGSFYKLNAGSGTTEIYRGNKANFPRIAGIVGITRSSASLIVIYDLTEPNCPMWMVFPAVVAGVIGTANGYPITCISTLNGIVVIGFLGTGLTRVNFIKDNSIINDVSSNSGICRVNISKRTQSNTGYYLLANTALPSRTVNSVSMCVLPGAPIDVSTGLPIPTIAVGTATKLTVIGHDGVVRTSSGTAGYTNASLTNRTLMANVANTLYYSGIKALFSNNFALTTYAPVVLDTNFKTMVNGRQDIRYISGTGDIFIHRLNNSNNSGSILSKANSVEATGWLVGDSRRCYCGDNGVSAMTTGAMLPPVSRARLVQRLGSEAQVYSLLSLGNGVVLAGTYPTGQVYRSTDNGLSFNLVQRLGSETQVRSLLSLGNEVVLAGTGTTGQIYRSTDNGLSFTLVQRLGSEAYVYSLLSLGNGVVLAGTGNTGQIYRSTDNGLSFTLVQRLGSEAHIYSLHSLGNGLVLASTANLGQIYRSTDNGLSFSLVQRLGTETYVFSLLSLGNGIVLAGTGNTGQIYRSTDNGLSFNLVQRLGTQTQVYSLVSLGNGIVLAGTGNTGQIYRSTDNGLSFSLVQRLGTQTQVYSLVSLGNGIVLAGTYPTGRVHRYTFPYITGTLTKAPVAINADLTAYSGFSNSNYAREAYSADLDFGTAEWTLSAWIKIPSAHSALTTICHRGYSSGTYLSLSVTAGSLLTATAYDGTTTRTVTGTNAYNIDAWIKVRVSYTTDGSLTLSVNAITEGTTTGTPLLTLNNSNAVLTLGNNYALDAPFDGSLCLLKLSATVPSADQMLFMYGQESQLFRDNAKCTVPIDNTFTNPTNMLSYDYLNGTYKYLTNTTESTWDDIIRIDSKTIPSGSYSQISSNSGITLEGQVTSTPGVDISLPYKPIAGYLPKYTNQDSFVKVLDYIGGFTATTYGTTTAFLALSQTTRAWKGIAIYAGDVYACVYGGDIYKQTAMSGNFVTTNQSSLNWNGLAGSGDLLYAYVHNGDIYKYDKTSGLFVALNQTSRPWTGMAISGNTVYACARGGDIYKQTNATGDFVAIGEQTLLWSGMTALNGNIYACVDGGDIYKQTNGTGSFTALGQTSRYWTDMCATLTDIYASVGAADIYKQTNATGTFTATSQTSRAWSGLCQYGTDVYASVDNGDIYKLNLNSTILGSISGLTIPDQTTYVGAMITGTGIPTNTQLYNVVGTTGYVSKPTTASGSNVQISFRDFILPPGHKTLDVMVNGAVKLEGSTKDYTLLHDGFREIVRFNTAPGYNAWVQIKTLQDT